MYSINYSSNNVTIICPDSVYFDEVNTKFHGPAGTTTLKLSEGFRLIKSKGSNIQLVYSLSSFRFLRKSRSKCTIKRQMKTYGSLIKQALLGVTLGHKKELKLVGVGYRATINNDSVINLRLGKSHEIYLPLDKELYVTCPTPTTIFIKGADLVKVTQFAALVRSLRLPEPYKGKGIFYKGETIRRKEGKKN